MMQAADIRQSYLTYFQERGHTLVPSSSLMPTAPNLLFTNSGMNQFVPYFLEERQALDTRVVDTQKCIRAGGKHNDLDDVGFDGYHHTFFEMLGNWSFGDYFKKEAIHWAWDLLTKKWEFPKNRLYVTVYQPGEGDPACFDQDAYDIWTGILKAEGMDPAVHICYGRKKDNFWMMGETGPCGPCTEIHMDLTPQADTQGRLVNMDSPWCIELWNLVFIQFNAQADGSFVPLPKKHVDTGMGLERIAGILATTKNFTTYTQPPSNYNSDLFTDLFLHIERLSGVSYGYTLPTHKNRSALSPQEQNDCTFRVLADHIRTLSFAIADGILPSNEGRGYVLRRILRRAVLFGKRLSLKPGFLNDLLEPLAAKMASVFPELQTKKSLIHKVLESEQKSFERTIDRGLQVVHQYFTEQGQEKKLTALQVFTLYDTYGFPFDLTQIIADEKGYAIDAAGFEVEMEKQRARARAAQQKTVIEVQQVGPSTIFEGYEIKEPVYSTLALGIEAVKNKNEQEAVLITEKSCFYAEMGGQVGDCGFAQIGDDLYTITHTTKDSNGRFFHHLDRPTPSDVQGQVVELKLDVPRRRQIERHHSATHLLQWALREILGSHVGQAGSFVNPDYLRFDFSHFEGLTPSMCDQIERLVNEKILENHPVTTKNILLSEKPDDVIAFFGDKYTETVRVVDIGGFSKELCAGTHVRHTGEIGLFKIIQETAISAGTRRIEAVCGWAAQSLLHNQYHQLHALAQRLSCRVEDVEKRLVTILEEKESIEKKLIAHQQQALSQLAQDLSSQAHHHGGIALVCQVVDIDQPQDLKSLAFQVGHLTQGLVVLASIQDEQVSLAIFASPTAIQAGYCAPDVMKKLSAALGGKGGGKPDFAMGGAKANRLALDQALQSLMSDFVRP